MTTDLAEIEAALATFDKGFAIPVLANSRDWLAELVERVKAAEAEVERLADWKASALPVMDGLQELGKSLGLPLGARITGPLAYVAAETLNARAEAAEATIASVRALAEEHPGTAWNSGLNLRQALRDALGGTLTDATEGDGSADDERNRFSGEDTDEPTQPILRPGAHRAPCADGDVCGEPSNCPPARCASNITLRDEEHRLVMCALPDAHDGDHDDRNGVTWTAEILRPTDQRYEPPAVDHESGCCR